MIKLQVTLFDKENKYKPISTIVNVESMTYYTEHKKEVQIKAIQNICHNRRTTWYDLQQQGYKGIKVREYNIEKIEIEKKINLLKKIKESVDKKNIK